MRRAVLLEGAEAQRRKTAPAALRNGQNALEAHVASLFLPAYERILSLAL